MTIRTMSSQACSKVCGENQFGRARIVLLQVPHHSSTHLRYARRPIYRCLCDRRLLDKLNVSGPEITLDISTIVGVSSIRTRKVPGLCVKDVEG